MDLNTVTLEITSLIITLDHYDALVSDSLRKKQDGPKEEQEKIRGKSRDHLNVLFSDAAFYDQNHQLKKLSEIKTEIKDRLKDVENKKIHELVERLEKDAKKMKKLYKALQQ